MKTTSNIINRLYSKELKFHCIKTDFFDIADFKNEVETLAVKNNELVKFGIFHANCGEYERLFDDFINPANGLIDTESLLSEYSEDFGENTYIFTSLEDCKADLEMILENENDEDRRGYLQDWKEELDYMDVADDAILVLNIDHGWQIFSRYETYIHIGYDKFTAQAALAEKALQFINK